MRNALLSRLSDRDRRTLAMGLSVVTALLLLTKGGPMWIGWRRDAQASAVEMAADAARSDAVVAAYPVLRDSLHVRAHRLRSLDSTIVGGTDPASAAASLATIVSDAAADAGIKLGAVQPHVDSEPQSIGARQPATHQAFAHVSVRADALGDIVALTQFLADLEHGPVLLAVRSLSITQPEPAAPSSRMETLHAEFTVVGLARTTDSRDQCDSSLKTTAVDSVSRSRPQLN